MLEAIKPKESRLLKLECVVGENTGDAVVEANVCLNQRAKKIADIQVRIVDLKADVVDGQVMIQGTLHKQIFFVGEDDRIHHQFEDVPFVTFVEVAGAEPGMNAHVHGTIAKVTHTLEFFTDLRQRAVLQFFVKVTEDCQLNVLLDPCGPLIKAECVVGEDVVATPVENVTELERPAIKVRDVRVFLEDVTAELAEDQVLFQGTLVKDIFYIGMNDQEFFQEERVPFSGIAEVPGARPGQNVQIKPSILRVDRILTNGNQVRQRVIIQVFIKVTEPCQVKVDVDDRGALVLAKKVVAENSRQVMLENVTHLKVPAQKVQDITAKVVDVTTEIIPNKVIIQGTIHKQIFFVGPDDVVHHQAEDVSFSSFVEVPGAQPWMEAQVFSRVEHIAWHLIDRVHFGHDHKDPKDPPANCTVDPYAAPEHKECVLFCKILQKIILEIFVKVAEFQQIRVKTLHHTAAAAN